MERSIELRNAFIRAAVLQAAKCGKTPVELLNEIILARFNVEGQSGKMVISTSENGGSVSMSIPDGFGPAAVMALCQECIQWIERQEDPANPDLSLLTGRVRRLRAGFDMGVIS